MEKLKLHFIVMEQALIMLDGALVLYDILIKCSGTTYDMQQQYEDALIQRFEYNVELFWKMLKCYLATTYRIEDAQKPRKIFGYVVLYKLCSEEEGEILLDMLEAHNETSQRYDFEVSGTLFPLIRKFYSVMAAVSKRIEPA